MVKKSQLLEVEFGPYALWAVRHGDPPFPGRDGSTYLEVAASVRDHRVAVRVADDRYDLASAVQRIHMPQPLIGENSVVSIYIEGPIPSSIRAAPRSDSARERFARGGFQHFEVRYRGAVGEVSWTWETAEGAVEISLECFPSKLDYRRDFDEIRSAIERVAPSLTASAGGAAAAGFSATNDSTQGSDLEWLQMVEWNYLDLKAAIERLLPSLRRQLQSQSSVTTRDRMRRSKPSSRRAYAPGRANAAIEVTSLVDGEASAVNGYLKWEVERLRSVTLGVVGAKWFTKLDPSLQRPVSALAEDVARWSKRMRHIPVVMALPNLQVKLRDPLYESAFRSIYSLRQALEPLIEARPVGLKDLPTLYEYWVFLQVVEILRDRFPLIVRQSEMMVQRAGPDLVLTPGRRSEVVLADDDGKEVACQYNRLFTKLPTANQKPDAVISIRGGQRLLLIDAKYRLGRDPDYIRQYGLEGPLAEDINVLHRYRDAIVGVDKPHARRSQAGLIAFPGRESSRYQNHKFYRSWLSVRVGGIPMLPAGNGLMSQVIKDYLDEMMLEESA